MIDEPIGDLFFDDLLKLLVGALFAQDLIETVHGFDKGVVHLLVLGVEGVLLGLHERFLAAKVEGGVLGKEIQCLLCLFHAGSGFDGAVELVDRVNQLLVLIVNHGVS